MLYVVVNDEYSFGGVGAAVLRLGLLRKRENTGCPKKKSLEANISGFQGPGNLGNLGKIGPVLKTSCSQLSFEHKNKSIPFQHHRENWLLKR